MMMMIFGPGNNTFVIVIYDTKYENTRIQDVHVVTTTTRTLQCLLFVHKHLF